MSEGTLFLNFFSLIFFCILFPDFDRENIKKLVEILWQGCQNRIPSAQGKIFRGNFFKSFFQQSSIFTEKLWLPGKICFRVVKTLLFVSRWSISRKKFLFDLLFFHPFRTSNGENFVFRRNFFDKIVRVHSTCAEENSEENKFSVENYIFSSFLEFEKNCSKLRDKIQEKIVYTYLEVLVGTL